MNGDRRKRIQDSVLILMGALERMRNIYEEEQEALDRIPDTEEYESERDDQEEIVGKLDEIIFELEEAIETLMNAGLCEVPAWKPAVAPAPVSEPTADPAVKVDSASSIQEVSVTTTPAKEKGIGCFGWFLAIVAPLILSGPLTVLLLSAYLDSKDFLYLPMIFVNLVIYIFFVRGLANKLKEPLPSSSLNDAQTYHDDHDDGQAAAFMGGLLGGYFLGKAMNKDRKSLADRMHDDIFWQEKYRRHDD